MELMVGGNDTNATARFYRVARTAVVGTVDGQGFTLGQIPAGLTNAIAISAGPYVSSNHSLVLRSNGLVVAWGYNEYNQVNVPTNLIDVVAIAAGGLHSVAVQRGGSIVMWGDESLGQTNAPSGLTNVVDVKAGLFHTVALKADGTVAAWGLTFLSTNAVPTGLSNVTAIAAAGYHCLALKSDSTVTAWGFDPNSPTNVPAGLSNVIAIAAGEAHNQALLKNGTIVPWGTGAGTSVPSGLTNVFASSAGYYFGLALHQDTTPIGWGFTEVYQGLSNVVALSANTYHWLYIVTNTDNVVIRRQPPSLAIPIGQSTNLEVVATGAAPLLYQWQKYDGINWNNITGATNAGLSFTNFQDANDGLYRVQVSNAINSLISSNASLIAMHPPVITNQTPALAIRCPQGGTVALTALASSKGSSNYIATWYHETTVIQNGLSSLVGGATKTIFCNGPADEGQYRVVISNGAGSATSDWWQATITLKGEATAWGSNTNGQLLSSRTETNLVAIAAGGYHTIGLRENGTVMGWGNSSLGQTNPPAGLSNVTAIAAGLWHNLALKEDGRVVAWGDSSANQTNVPGALSNIVAVAAGSSNSLALQRDGTISAWGSDAYGESSGASGLTNVMAIAAGAFHGLALHSNGLVSCWGNNSFGQCVLPSEATNVVGIAAGSTHSLALRADGKVIGWGTDFSGESSGASGLTNAMKISAGLNYSLVLRNDGVVVAYGTNNLGQTNVPAGLGDTHSVSAGYFHAVALAYSPLLNYPVTVSQDLLLIYNTNSTDSATVKNYYLAHRPKVGGANVLGVGCVTNEIMANVDFTNQIVAPVLNWLTNNPTKRPGYFVLFLDIPSRLSNYLSVGSVSYGLRQRMPGIKPFITHINMNGTNDCKAYIDKLEFIGTNYSPNKIILSASTGNYGNTNYVLDGIRFGGPFPFENYSSFGHVVSSATNGLLAAGTPANAILFADGLEICLGTNSSGTCTNVQALTHPTTATNVAGYICWGAHSTLGAAYAAGLQWNGNSAWWIIETIESFNGWRADPGQGTSIKWFSQTAFGGTNYSNIPVGAATHVEEPGLPNVNSASVYFGLWASGKKFSIAAWNSRLTPFFQAVGDPLVTK